MLTPGGYVWTVVPVARRTEYLPALAQASSHRHIGSFAQMLAQLAAEQTGVALHHPRHLGMTGLRVGVSLAAGMLHCSVQPLQISQRVGVRCKEARLTAVPALQLRGMGRTPKKSPQARAFGRAAGT